MGFTWGYFTWTPKYVEWKNIYIRIDYFLGPPCMPVCRSVTTQVLWWGSQLLDQTVMILHVFWGKSPFSLHFLWPIRLHSFWTSFLTIKREIVPIVVSTHVENMIVNLGHFPQHGVNIPKLFERITGPLYGFIGLHLSNKNLRQEHFF